MIRIYTGIIESDPYGYRTDRGYEPSLTLECDDGESLSLGNTNYGSIFSDMVGQRIRLSIDS